MPETDRLSWLTLKRRRTTGNLKTVPSGQMKTVAEEDGPDEMQEAMKHNYGADRPVAALRPASQPNVPRVVKNGEGNLLYAYARKDDEPKAGYLLTFATVSAANQWWSLVQANFPNCSRPGLQLFSFRDPEILSEAWGHPAFEHLRSRWMYIALPDIMSQSPGSAAHGLIPVQDRMGIMLDRSTPLSPVLTHRSIRMSKERGENMEQSGVRFKRMMEATVHNTDSIDRHAEHKVQHEHHDSSGYSDTSSLAGSLGKMSDLLARNIEHNESVSKKQSEHEQRLTAALEDFSSVRNEDHTTTIRNDSVPTSVGAPPTLDFTPLATSMEKMQQAVEQNSLLLTRLMEERSTAAAEARYKTQLDLLPISDTLEKIHAAVEKQNLHTNALLEILRDDKDAALQATKANGETLDRILQAQIETKEAVEQHGGEIDFAPVAEHMDAIRETTTENTEQIRTFVELQRNTSPAAAAGGNKSIDIDFSPMTDRLDRVHAALEKTTDYFQAQSPGTGDAKFLISALTSHLSKIQAVTEQNANAIKTMRDRQTLPLSATAAPATTTDSETHVALRETTEQLRALTQALTEQHMQREKIQKPEEDGRTVEKRIEATSPQVRELMAGQRDMVNVMRELALSITAKEKDVCDHVVIPPPRKVGKKIVGFVYDRKEAMS